MPNVFQPGTRPWVKAEGASTEEIIKQIQKCPSRALSFYMNSPEREVSDDEPIKALGTGRKVEILKNGPLMIEGPITLVNSNGQKEVLETVGYFCRCGASNNKPFCDSSHVDIGFKE